MGMLGNQLAAGQALTVANDSFNGDGSTTAFTLSHTVSSVNDIEVLVDNVQQSPYDSSYSVSGTTLTFSGAPSAGTNNVYVIYNASRHIATSQVIPDDGSVTTAHLHTGLSVPDSNIAAMAASKLTGDLPYANMPAGSTLQTLQTRTTTLTTFTGTSDVDIMAVTITPKFASSKILVTVDMGVSHQDSYSALVKCKRGSTFIGGGVANSSYAGTLDNIWFNIRSQSTDNSNSYAISPCSKSFLDSPNTTSATTYTATVRQAGPASNSGYVNRPVTPYTNAYASSVDSIITVQEIAQ